MDTCLTLCIFTAAFAVLLTLLAIILPAVWPANRYGASYILRRYEMGPDWELILYSAGDMTQGLTSAAVMYHGTLRTCYMLRDNLDYTHIASLLDCQMTRKDWMWNLRTATYKERVWGCNSKAYLAMFEQSGDGCLTIPSQSQTSVQLKRFK